jgi:hypothetical protein
MLRYLCAPIEMSKPPSEADTDVSMGSSEAEIENELMANALTQAETRLTDCLDSDGLALLNLARQWVHVFFPHCVSKINRVAYGLLTGSSEQSSAMGAAVAARALRNEPATRRLLAVPFVGKDVPTESSEFAHPDIAIGLTVLAYRYEGLRLSDVHTMAVDLKRRLLHEQGPIPERPARVLLQSWLAASLARDGVGKAKVALVLPTQNQTVSFLQANLQSLSKSEG